MKTLLLCFLLCYCTSAYSQFALSLEGGVNFSTLHHNDIPDSVTKLYSLTYPTLAIGANYRFRLFTIGLKESYLKWGYRNKDGIFTDISGNIIGTGTAYQYNHSLLSSLDAGVIVGDKTRLNPFAGITMVNIFSEMKGQSIQINGSSRSESDDYYNTIYLFNVGASLTYPVSAHLMVDVSGNYMHSISKVYRPVTGWWMNNVELLAGIAYEFNSSATRNRSAE